MKLIINTLGIFLATIGSFLIWKFLKELNFEDKKAYIEGKGKLNVPRVTSNDIKKYKQSVFLSNFGLILILVGGALQILSNYLND